MLIDRYVARAQLHAFVIVFISLAGLTFVVDAFTNLEEFIGHAASAGGLGRVLGYYYGCRLISFFDATSSVIALASAMFALSWLERHHELTALLAAGVDRWRIARPTLVFAAVVSLLAMANRECVLPRIRQAIARNAQDLRGDMAQPFEAPSLLLPPTLGDHGTSLDAAEGFWRPATEQHPAGYLLRNVTEPAGIDLLPAVEQGGRTVIHTRAGSDWLQPGECFVTSDVTFEQLIGSTNWSQYSSTPELVRAVANPALGVGAEIPLRIHARQVQPLLDMALAILGIPLVAGPSRRGIFVAVGWCVGLTVLFFMIVLGCHALATGYIVSPSVGAWMPAVVLLPLAAWMAQPMWE
jgi:lipopolysaccharide export system permease protein